MSANFSKLLIENTETIYYMTKKQIPIIYEQTSNWCSCIIYNIFFLTISAMFYLWSNVARSSSRNTFVYTGLPSNASPSVCHADAVSCGHANIPKTTYRPNYRFIVNQSVFMHSSYLFIWSIVHVCVYLAQFDRARQTSFLRYVFISCISSNPIS